MTVTGRPARGYPYVPGNGPDKLGKAPTRGAGAPMIDQ